MKLLTFLGTRPIETTYVMQDGREFTAPFCGVALIHLLDIEDVRVFVTREAREQALPVFQERTQAAGVQVVPVDIPGDATQEDLWRIFKAVVESVEEKESVIFDITHGFRSVSFLSFLAASYLRIVKDVHLAGVFYGNFEARDRSVTPNRAPVIDLTRMTGLLDWMIAADRFERFGDARDLADLLRRAAPSWEEQQRAPDLKGVARRIRQAANAMESVSRSLRLIRPDEAMEASWLLVHRVREAAPDMVRFAPPFDLLATPVVESYRPLALDVKANRVAPCEVLERERRMIRWYLERHQYVQALALTREWLVSWTMLWSGEPDFKNRTRRERVERRIGAALRGQRREAETGARAEDGDLSHIPHRDALLRLYDRVGQMRNDLLHAGKRASPIPAKQAEQRIVEWCTEAIGLPLPEEC